eukprot:scaffold146960_cov30-Tisochrysis_lutea.AAC.4
MRPPPPPMKMRPCGAPLGDAKAVPPKVTQESDLGSSPSLAPIRPSCALRAQKGWSCNPLIVAAAAAASRRLAPVGGLLGGERVQNLGCAANPTETSTKLPPGGAAGATAIWCTPGGLAARPGDDTSSSLRRQFHTAIVCWSSVPTPISRAPSGEKATAHTER